MSSLICKCDYDLVDAAVVGIYGASKPVNRSGSEEIVFPKENHAPVARKLLISPNTTGNKIEENPILIL